MKTEIGKKVQALIKTIEDLVVDAKQVITELREISNSCDDDEPSKQ